MRIGAALLSASLALASGCAKPEPPTLTPTGATVTSVSPAGLGLNVVLQAKNPNSIDLDAQKVVADITLDGTVKLAHVVVSQPVHLPANKTTTLTVPMQAGWNNLLALAPLTQKQGNIPFSVDGKVTVGGGLEIEVPFQVTGSLTAAELTKVAASALPKIPGLTF